MLAITASTDGTVTHFIERPSGLARVAITAILGAGIGLFTAWTWWRVVKRPWPKDDSGFLRRHGLLFGAFMWLAFALGPVIWRDYSLSDLFRYGNVQAQVLMKLLAGAPINLWAGYWWANTMGVALGIRRR